MPTTITNTAVLESVATMLHDARFTADAAGFDASARTFTRKCWVLEPKPKPGGDSRRWQACLLTFTNVTDSKVSTRETVPYYELATIRFIERERRLDLVTHYGIEISLITENLGGALTETTEMRGNWE